MKDDNEIRALARTRLPIPPTVDWKKADLRAMQEAQEGFVMGYKAAVEHLRADIRRYQSALELLDRLLTCPAAEYAPAIQACFKIIDEALK